MRSFRIVVMTDRINDSLGQFPPFHQNGSQGGVVDTAQAFLQFEPGSIFVFPFSGNCLRILTEIGVQTSLANIVHDPRNEPK